MTIDLLIENGDLVLNAGEPVLIFDNEAIAQDLKHKIIESLFLLKLVAERDPFKRRALIKNIKQLIDNDSRIKPGLTTITETKPGKLEIAAFTLDKKPLEILL